MTLPFPKPSFETESHHPVYRQLADQIRSAITGGQMVPGDKLPPTRDLAGHLGLNRSTISAAYSLLEEDGLVSGHVGRGSFVASQSKIGGSSIPSESSNLSDHLISFSTSRPGEELFPLEDFRTCCDEVLHSKEIHQILQLGSPYGYGPLRRFLLNEARKTGSARSDDEILITNGCQQALDLLERAYSEGVAAVEDPVYPGVKSVFAKPGRRVLGLAVGDGAIDLSALTAQVKIIVVTPNFQNPTGSTMTLETRRNLIQAAREIGAQLVENNIYEELRYSGTELPSLKLLDTTGSTIQLGSFSKIAFPGLRIGWILGPRAIINRLAEIKESCDLHSDQLSQAVLLRFAESGRMRQHRDRIRRTGAVRLEAVLDACARNLPAGSKFTRPEGGMNLWVTLPAGLDASDIARHAGRAGVSYLPGRAFAVNRDHSQSFRLSFAGLEPARIAEGLARLGQLFAGALAGELPHDRSPEAVV